MERSGIGLLIRASKSSRSAGPAKPQSRTLVKDPTIRSLIQTAAAMVRIAKAKSTTRLFRKSRIGRPKRGSGDCRY